MPSASAHPQPMVPSGQSGQRLPLGPGWLSEFRKGQPSLEWNPRDPSHPGVLGILMTLHPLPSPPWFLLSLGTPSSRPHAQASVPGFLPMHSRKAVQA